MAKTDCVDKLVFDTKAQAQGHMAALAWRYRSKLKVYRCSSCTLWHLASDYGRE